MSDQLLQLYPPCELCQVRKKLQLFAVNQSLYQDKD